MGIVLPHNPGDIQSGLPHSAADVVANDQAAASWSVTHETATMGVHGVGAGAIVGTTLSQTLSNKTLTSPIVSSPQITGAGAGKATLQYANSANDRTITFQDFAAGYSVMPLDLVNLSIVNMRFDRYGSGTGITRIVGIDGNALSSSNPAYVMGPNSSLGKPQLLTFTASPTFNDDAHADSHFVGSGTFSWGTTAAVAWANDMPFVFGVCTDGTTPIIVSARLPVATTGASSNIGYQDNAPSSANQKNVFAWTSTNVTVTHANKPIRWIGSFRMTKSASDDWTVTSVDNNTEGIGHFYNFGSRYYTFPQAQSGCGGTAPAAGTHILTNGGTVPTFTTKNYFYKVDMKGQVSLEVMYDSDAGGDGAGAVNLYMSAPFSFDNNSSSFYSHFGISYVNAAGVGNNFGAGGFFSSDGGNTTLSFGRNSSATGTSNWLLSNFSNGGRSITLGDFKYPTSL